MIPQVGNYQAVLPAMDGTALTLEATNSEGEHANWLNALKVNAKVMRVVTYQTFGGEFNTVGFNGHVTEIDEKFVTCVIWVNDKPTLMKFRQDTGQSIYGQWFGYIDKP